MQNCVKHVVCRETATIRVLQYIVFGPTFYPLSGGLGEDTVRVPLDLPKSSRAYMLCSFQLISTMTL